MKTQISSTAFKKVLSIISFLILFYVVPLSGNPALLLNWKVIFLATICTILFATQPRLSLTESREKKSTDRNTIWLIILVSGVGQIAAILEWAYFPGFFQFSTILLPNGQEIHHVPILNPELRFINFEITGAVMLIAGTLFRLYAIHVLGKYFSTTVQIKSDHRIISDGPYKCLRHPSYTGAYVAMVGAALFLQSLFGFVLLGIGMLWVYTVRVKAEERTLTERFGILYKLYASRTYKMFPLVW